MKKRLYLMRHGQTLFNVRRKIQGASDSPLTEEGIRQAKIAKEYFIKNNIQFDYAYSSTQERASDTLEIITDLPYERVKGLKEWNFGLFEGESEDLNPPIDPKVLTYGDFFVKFQGESEMQVQSRMNDTLIKIMERDNHNSVLAVGHGGAIHMFRKKWHMPSLGKIANCSIFVFDFEDGKFEFVELINHDFSK